MLVSIIVPVYNVEKYIERCFNSIVKQTYLNIECIFIDDSSPDNSITILSNLIKEYNGNIIFSVLRHEKNRGLSEARNTGIRNAKGEYLYFLDSDDEITELCIQTLTALAKQYQDVDIVQGNTIKMPSNTYYYDIALKRFPEYTDNKLWLKKHFFTFPTVPVNAWNKLIKRSFITENALYFYEGIVHEDALWMFFAAKKIKTMAFSSYYCYIYYSTPGSIMRSDNITRSLQSYLFIICTMLENIDIEVLRETKGRIYSALRSQLYKISARSEYQIFLHGYRKIIKICLKDARKAFDFFGCLGLSLLLLPCYVYRNIFYQYLIKLLFFNYKNIFLPSWYKSKWKKVK